MDTHRRMDFNINISSSISIRALYALALLFTRSWSISEEVVVLAAGSSEQILKFKSSRLSRRDEREPESTSLHYTVFLYTSVKA
jgi:hypothetical protein